MRIVAWNIRAGGGVRAAAIEEQLSRWQPDVASLCEYRATEPSQRLALGLAGRGLAFQETTARPKTASANSLLVASRWPLRRLRLRRAPWEPRRWLTVRVEAAAPFGLAAVHAPIMVTGRKMSFLAAIEATLEAWRLRPALLIGDTNCGWPGLDEETPVFNQATGHWLDSLAALGWRDAFRHLHGEERFYTWYSPNAGNGFRLDQAFLNRRLMPRLRSAFYEWGRAADGDERRKALSDHAALIVDLD